MDPSSVSNNSAVEFECFYTPRPITFNYTHCRFTITKDVLTATDDSGNKIFALTPAEITSLEDKLNTVLIVTPQAKHYIFFGNLKKAYKRALFLGIFAYGGKSDKVSGVSPEVQARCKEAVIQLKNLAYNIELNPVRTK